MIEDASYRPSYVSDLSAALATVEMSSGKHKIARQLFAKSMTAPSENALAQTQWASERDSKITIPAEAWRIPFPHEAQALAARIGGDWDTVLSASEKWLSDEPYSIRPAAVGSFASFTDDQVRRSERLASMGLGSNPESRILLNNRAVARAYLGDLPGSYADIKRALRLDKIEDPVLIATLGLLAYRSGRPDTGSRCYQHAIEIFISKKDKIAISLAILFWLREEIGVGSPDVGFYINYFEKNISRITGGKTEPELLSMLNSVKGQLLGTTKPIPFADHNGTDCNLESLVREHLPSMPDHASSNTRFAGKLDQL
jgi:tetratricopeptide (TPR) repeat protein